ncbi:hypothetical protein B1H58_18640 [Pantoea alhagi]|uniref:Uncharacterized protein n=1 Tax=Pantoea alhagi TaxID=1891675 RepID=A0A1W6B9S8_9GAMM|nr:hypothetical protein B1H58_18640 [Pantoea alhagi]
MLKFCAILKQNFNIGYRPACAVISDSFITFASHQPAPGTKPIALMPCPDWMTKKPNKNDIIQARRCKQQLTPNIVPEDLL